MKRRDFLLGTGATVVAGSVAGCGPRSRETAVPPAFAPVRNVINRRIDPATLPGAVWLVAHGDEVVVHAAGMQAVGSDASMRRDTIFRIASMSKSVTAAAVLMLVEEGKLTLDENAERLLPELANRRVLRTLQSPVDDTIPARAPITVQQLMDYTLGSGLVFDTALPINRAIKENQLVIGTPIPMTPHDPDQWMSRFGALPLMYQPGERWLYDTGSAIQGVLVRRASGMDFDTFVEERITGPLGMRDTGFYVPANKLERFAGCALWTNAETQQPTRMDRDGADSAYAARPVFPSGAAGLCSTVDDYLAFARMLKKGGEHNGRRLLSAEYARRMTTNQLSDTVRRASAESLFPNFFDTYSWGHGLAVQIAPNRDTQAPGAFGWEGGFGTSYFVDPDRDVISIVMTQCTDFLFDGGLAAYRSAVYQATA
jgi:CubicO group peptidase (beta-lactamase class C family)